MFKFQCTYVCKIVSKFVLMCHVPRRNVRGPGYKFSLQISRLELRHEQRPLRSGPTRKFVNTIKTNIFKP